MPENQSTIAGKVRGRTLYSHFFRRFFDNDTLSLEAETQTTVIRALCAFAVPTLMVAFWLLPIYPGRAIGGVYQAGRDPWLIASDRYFFVLYSFVAMGTVTTFEWQMLFPDRSDFLILLPLGIKTRELFFAKGKALLAFLAMFLVAANIFSLILYPAVSTRAGDNFWLSLYAHFVSVALAGIFAAFAMLGIQGTMICLLPSAWFRAMSTILQSLSITALLLLLLLFPLCGNHMQSLLQGRTTFAQFVPPLWFVSLYEYLMHPAAPPSAARGLVNTGLVATGVAVCVALITYPLAWSRQQKRALEGASSARRESGALFAGLLHRTLIKRPQQRAIFHFISQTISRSTRYQVYLAIYSGIGLALALCSIVTLRIPPGTSNQTIALALSNTGLHAILPLLLFWMVTGLRAAFAFPVDMLARWVFPINLPNPANDAKAAKIWIMLCCGALTAVVFCILLSLKWSWLDLAIQAICGISLALILADLFFVGRTQIPFTRPRMPGRANLPIVFTLYGALFPLLVYLTVQLELATEAHFAILVWIVLGTLGIHVVLRVADYLAQKGIIGGFPEDEGDEGPLTLNLFQ